MACLFSNFIIFACYIMNPQDCKTPPASIATVGTFDGLHKGHRRVLEMLKKQASIRNLRPLVVTFDRHPLETVAPERAPGLILNPSHKFNELRKEGLDLNIVEFSAEVAATTAQTWMKKLRDEFGVKVLVVGYDNTFGSDGIDMDINDYARLGNELGIEVLEAPLEKGVSSSAVRRAVGKGEIERANAMLGRDFCITGVVEHGEALGRRLGFPTANVKPSYRVLMPLPGVYEAEAVLDNGRVVKAVVNVGSKPTVGGERPFTIEAHLIDFDGDLYGRNVILKFKRFLRPEQCFPNLDALKFQIGKDVEEVKTSV